MKRFIILCFENTYEWTSDIYRLWINEERESHLTDLEILDILSDSPQTPFGIAGGHHRVSTVRIQCHYLNQLGYLNQTSIDTYTITTIGENARDQSSEFSDGYVRLEEKMKLDYDHVTDLGELLDASTIIGINKEFYENKNVDYESDPGTLQEITNIRDERLERLTMEFPRFEPLTNQLAHMVRTFCGHHLFPDANHRTGTHIADVLASKQGYDLFTAIQNDKEGIKRAVEISKILRGLCSNVRNSVEYLWMKDELFYHWNRYFRDLLYELSPQKRVHTTTGECQYDNLASNKEVSLMYRYSIQDIEDMQEFFSQDQ